MTYKLNPFTGKLDTSDGPQGPAGVVSAAGPGSQAAPSISFAADLDTGLYNYTPDGIAVSTGGTGKLFIDASGKVGIGGPSTLSVLTVTDALASTTIDGGSIETTRSDGFYIQSPDNTRFYTAGSERLRITSAGNVGIGTTLPYVFTQIEGQLMATGSADQFASEQKMLIFGRKGRTSLDRHNYVSSVVNFTTGNDNKILFYVDDSSGTNHANPLTLTGAGNVGIGTQNPGYLLDLSASTPVLNIASSATSGDGAQIRFTQNLNRVGRLYLTSEAGSGSGSMTLETPDNRNIVFRNTSNERARIDSSGRLLVGTSNARTDFSAGTIIQLEGVGSGAARYAAISNNNLAADGSGFYFARSRGTADGSNTIVLNNDVLGGLFFHGADGTDLASRAGSIECAVDGTPGSNTMPGRLVFSTTSTTPGASPTPRMTIKNDGNVGIGVTNPLAKLHAATTGGEGFRVTTASAQAGNVVLLAVAGVSNGYQITNDASNNINHIWHNAGGEKARIDSSGRLLVGTLSSSQNISLVIEGNSGGTDGSALFTNTSSTPSNGTALGALKFSDAGQVPAAQIISRRDGGTWTSGTSQPTLLEFSTTPDGTSSPTPRMTIKNDGKVGIGTSSPDSELHISKADTTTKLILERTNSATAKWSMSAGGGSLLFRDEASSNERLRITSDAYVRLASGSGGIQFNGDTAAANALDDYEEGTWTPTVYGSSTAGTYTVTASGATYTKVGNIVNLQARISFSAASGGVGNIQIGGLPFVYAANQVVAAPPIFNSVDFGAADYVVVAHVGGGAASILGMTKVFDATSSAPLGISSITTSSSFQINVTYRT